MIWELNVCSIHLKTNLGDGDCGVISLKAHKNY